MAIILNVSGKIFRVSRDIICKSQLFNGMLSDCLIDSEIIIDRSAKLFKHVYAYLLDDQYPYPRKYHTELDYYLVEYDIDALYDPFVGLMKKIEKINTEIEKLQHNQCEIYSIINATRSVDSSVPCPGFGCQNLCMIPPKPTCEWCAGKCCYHSQDFYGEWTTCERKIDFDQTYCDNHIFDH